MDNADAGMKRVMTYLFTGLLGVFVSIIYLANSIA
ncbi:MAG: hypothetical protein BMS9Abin19_0969 [Gammaproteobacteria bacterium]|nr:MAG: hypothetical protein BMS9Abin19_0969 [Gammaproteobacteria bacterium]